MSIKKTWFSYILWLIAAGFSVLFTCFAVANVTKCFGIYGHNQIGFVIGYSAGVIGIVVLLCLLIRKLFDKICLPKMNKWVVRSVHVLAFVGIAALFIWTRYYSFLTGGLHSEQMVVFYEMSRIGFISEDLAAMEAVLGNVSLVPSVFENVYLKILSMLFLFLGNKLELLDVLQLILQCVSLFSLYIIGWNIQKGLFAWIPAFIYAGSPIYASMIGDFGPSNFFFCITVLGMVLCFALQKVWKNRFITYIMTNFWGIGVCVFVFCTKFAVLFQNAPAFFVRSDFRQITAVVYTEFLLWAVILIMYCVTFWFVKTDVVSLYVIPSVLATGLLLALQYYECDVTFFLTLFIGFWISLLGTEGLRLLCIAKPQVITGQNTDVVLEIERTVKTSEPKKDDCEDFDWTEMKMLMEQKEEPEQAQLEESVTEENGVSEDTGVIRVSDILKAVGTEDTKTGFDEGKQVEDAASPEILDKTAMIENVLPMPKKHVGRSFEYSFEPTEEMMHYDVEVENDDYDYE